jgi:hypothetical protein
MAHSKQKYAAPPEEYYLKQTKLVRECLWALKNIILRTDPGIHHRRMYQIPFFFYGEIKISFLWVKQRKIYVGLVRDKRLYATPKNDIKMIEINPTEDIPEKYISEMIKSLIAGCEYR